MKKMLLVLVVMILIALGVSACQTSEEQPDFDTYDYYLLIVVSRQRLNQDTFVYVLHEAGESDNFTYESEELWSVGEFVIAIEIDEQENVYFTGLNTTTSMIVAQYQKEEKTN